MVISSGIFMHDIHFVYAYFQVRALFTLWVGTQDVEQNRTILDGLRYIGRRAWDVFFF